jgi:hypothetical protein
VKQSGFLVVGMIKKQWVMALVLLLLIPVVWALGGMLFNLMNPEIAAGRPHYGHSYQLLGVLKHVTLWASEAGVAGLWLLVCLLVIRSKKRSGLWLFLAALGPLGFAVLAGLNDRAPAEADRYARFVRNLNGFVRAGYELCIFVIVLVLAYEAMALKRTITIAHEAATTGVSTAQIMDLRDASGGMWAFAEGNEVMYGVVLLYLLWPIVFNMVGRAAAMMVSRKAR